MATNTLMAKHYIHIHMLTIFIIKKILYLKFKKTMTISFALDLIYMLLYVYEYNVLPLKYLLPFVFIFVVFKTNFHMYFKSLIMYYIISYALGGISTTLKLSGNKAYFLIFLILMILVSFLYLSFRRKELFISYKITYEFKGKKYCCDAFFDTGCNLLYKGLPVIILNKKYHFNIYSEDVLKFNSGGIERLEKVYKIYNLKIMKNQIDCYCAFLDIDYDAIVGVNVINL